MISFFFQATWSWVDITITEQPQILPQEPPRLPLNQVMFTRSLFHFHLFQLQEILSVCTLEKYPTELSVQMEKYPIIGSKSGRRILVKRAFSDGKSKKHKGFITVICTTRSLAVRDIQMYDQCVFFPKTTQTTHKMTIFF